MIPSQQKDIDLAEKMDKFAGDLLPFHPPSEDASTWTDSGAGYTPPSSPPLGGVKVESTKAP